MIDSSRQTGVVISFARSAWPRMSSSVERLLDQQQVEGVEAGQVARVGERVRRVGVDLQQHVVAVPLPDGTHRLHVPARLDLELDPEVALVEVAADGVEELGDAVHDPDRDAARHPVVDRSELATEGPALCAELGVQDAHLQGRLGHPMTLELMQPGRDGQGVELSASGQRRDEEAAQDIGRSVGVLR